MTMPDFLKIGVDRKKNVVYPVFIVKTRTKDLMIRGGDFYAIWDEDNSIWSTDEQTVIDIVDHALTEFVNTYYDEKDAPTVHYMWDSRSGSIDQWHKYCQKQMRDVYHNLDERVIFANTELKKTDYASKKLPYPLKAGPIDAYDELMSTLYDPSEREKLEWAIGSIVAGDSKDIQKFEVLYGSHGTGKSTVLNIIQKLFDGYWNVFNAKELGSASSAFALESFKTNPLVSIQHDGDLSRIEDNTKLNSIVSHESMEVNAKYTKIYTTKFNAFLFMGTNRPVKITEAKSGIIRRLIDVHPSGRTVSRRRYDEIKKQINFELSGIAWHCLQVYQSLGASYYDGYIPTEMMSLTNDFYDFVEHNYEKFEKNDMITQTEAWAMYQEYCDYSGAHKLTLRIFKNELRSYFKNFDDRKMINGRTYRSLYSGFLINKFISRVEKVGNESQKKSWLEFKPIHSLFDICFSDSPAQYAKEDGSPWRRWSEVTTILADLDTKELHWVKPKDKRLICVDFDIPDENGEKSLQANLEAASEWPKTYAELSKSGKGIHLYYLYDGDVSMLSRIFADHIEIKVFTGNSSLRRLVTMCNDIPIATISSGLPLKEEKKVIDWQAAKTDKELKRRIVKALKKEYHPDTSSSIDLINKMLEDAYESGMTYHIDDMLKNQILQFAMNSTNQAERCVNVVGRMHFQSKDFGKEVVVEDVKPIDIREASEEDRYVFYDCEVYPNLFVIVWKYAGAATCVRMINPSPNEVQDIIKFKLIGFNCRKYDNHILYARAFLRYSNQALFELSQLMINEHRGFFGPAYDISETDVYDFATEKMSLKKWEIKLDKHHQEMGIPWDQDVPDELISLVCEYCENDVRATEAVFEARKGDFMARKIQVALVKLLHGDEIKVTVNDTTNTLSKRIIFGKNTTPQGEFNWRYLKWPVSYDRYDEYREKFGPDYKFRVFNAEGLPEYRDYIPGEVLPDGYSILPFFPEYDFGFSSKHACHDPEVTERVGLGKSVYLDQNVGEGGRVFSLPGIWTNVWDGDISSQHPHSIIAECLFGPRFTKIFEELVRARVAVKHKDYKTASELLGGALEPYLSDEYASDLAQALKIVINSIYGLTKAGFINEFRDLRNEDNIVAKRGALFMTLLKREVEKLGYVVCHIKTDSIKIPNADDRIKNFVIKFGQEYGYSFETEGVFGKFCLLNDAAYVAKCTDGSWVTKATQFNKDSSPYVYKTLFSHEPLIFKDYCQTFSVSKGALYLDRTEGLPDVTEYEKLLEKTVKKLKKDGIDPTTDTDVQNLQRLISEGHDYHFIGRVGLFCPVVDGIGGGQLYRFDNGKYYAASGTTGYKWLEAEYVTSHGLQDHVNLDYYRELADQAVADISQHCDFEWFIAD